MRPQDSSTGVPACLRAARILAVGATAFGISAATASGAGATPAGDLQAQAAQLNAQIQAHGAKVAALGEQLDAAQLKLETAQAQMSQLETIVRERAVIIYQSTDVNSSLDFSTTNVLELTVRSKYASVLDAHDRQLLDRLNEAKREVTQQRVALVKDKADADAAAAQEQRLLSQVTGQLAVVIQEQRQQQQQAAAAVSVKLTTPPANNTWAGPAPSGGAGAAVAFAEAQLGKPYEYGAAGPDTYDCSGLTMRAWQAGGVSMPHFSGAQYSMFPRVPMSQLQPGDLVFPSDPSAHVGVYIGGGMMVHATHTGDVIREAPIVEPGLVMTEAVRP